MATNGTAVNGMVPVAAATTPVTKICVFCGSMPGADPAHMEAARQLAHKMAENNISLVYGGGTVGLMGEVARTLVSLSGPKSVHGIIPEPLMIRERTSEADEDGRPLASVYGRTTVVQDMHTRKRMMADEVMSAGPGSGFIALAGGIGTLEELMEMITWNQLGIHSRGVVVYNVDGYWDKVLGWLQESVQKGFAKTSKILQEGKTAAECVDALRNYELAEGRYDLKWENS